MECSKNISNFGIQSKTFDLRVILEASGDFLNHLLDVFPIKEVFPPFRLAGRIVEELRKRVRLIGSRFEEIFARVIVRFLVTVASCERENGMLFPSFIYSCYDSFQLVRL